MPTADASSATALRERGLRLLSGVDGVVNAETGRNLVLAAAALGDGEAHAMAAVLAAAGVAQPQDWTLAMNHLRSAASAGFTFAQRQLALLVTDSAEISPDADWAALRQRIDLERWLTPPAKRPLCASPRIRAIEGFASPAVCDWLIGRARDRLGRARTYDPQTGNSAVVATRTNSETDFNIVEADLVLLLVRARIAAATSLPPAVMELTKILHYAPGEQFERHYDYLDPAEPGMAREVALRGQRLATFLLYLNENYEGGETEFSAIGLRHRGRKGDAMFFANIDPQGAPDPQTLHAGLPPTSGEKWLLSQWIRDRAPAT